MTVLQLGPYPPPHGGVQTNLVAIRERLLQHGFGCLVLNLHRHRTGRGEGVYHPENAMALLRLLAHLRYDILHLHIGGSLSARLLGLCFLCTLRPARTVITFHSGGYATSPEGGRARPFTLRGFIFRRFDRIIAVNQEIAGLFRRFGVPPHKLRLIAPHALPAELPDACLPAELQRFVETHQPLLLSVGLLEPEYDLPLQIKALGRVRQLHPQAGLVLIGSGSLESPLRENIRAQPWAGHILLCGDVEHGATLRAIAAADVLLRTTLYDGDSVAVREALHLGTPVVATDNGMRPPGVWLIPAGTVDALCRAIEEAFSAPRQPQPPPQFSQDHIAAVLDLYRELLAGGGPR